MMAPLYVVITNGNYRGLALTCPPRIGPRYVDAFQTVEGEEDMSKKRYRPEEIIGSVLFFNQKRCDGTRRQILYRVPSDASGRASPARHTPAWHRSPGTLFKKLRRPRKGSYIHRATKSWGPTPPLLRVRIGCGKCAMFAAFCRILKG
jgi:hypothetical protein